MIMNSIHTSNREEYYFQFENYIQSRLEKLAAPTKLSECLVNEPPAKELVKKLAFKINKAQSKFRTLTDFRTICDLVNVFDDDNEYRALIECKCWYKPAFNDPLAELIARLDTDKPCIKMQWDLLARSNKPYLIIIGYHSKSYIGIEINAHKISDLIDEYLIIGGLGNKFTIHKSTDVYVEYFADILEIQELGGDIGSAIISDLYNNSTLLKHEFMNMIDNELGDQTAVNYHAINWADLLNYESEDMNKRKLITDIDNLTQYLTDRYLAGESTTEIKDDLIQQGYLGPEGKKLISANICNFVAPSKLIKIDFRPYLQDLKQIFKQAALKQEIKLHLISDEEASLLADWFSKTLKYNKTSKNTYTKWFHNHYQNDLLVECKKEAIEEAQLKKGSLSKQNQLALKYDNQSELTLINQKLDTIIQLLTQSNEEKFKQLLLQAVNNL